MLLSTIAALLSLTAAILAVLVVRDITSRQGQRAANLGARTL